MNNLKEDLNRIIQADEEQVSKINSEFLKKEARMIRRLAREGESA